jgi:hypothetical protein
VGSGARKFIGGEDAVSVGIEGAQDTGGVGDLGGTEDIVAVDIESGEERRAGRAELLGGGESAIGDFDGADLGAAAGASGSRMESAARFIAAVMRRAKRRRYFMARRRGADETPVVLAADVAQGLFV